MNSRPNDAIIGGRNMTTSPENIYQRVYEISNNVIQRGGLLRLDGNYEESDNTIINVIDNEIYNSRQEALEIESC